MTPEPAQARVARPVEVIVWVEAQDDDAAYEAVERILPGADGTGNPVINGVAVHYVTIVGTDTGLPPLSLTPEHDELYGPDERLHVEQVHGLTEAERQDMDDMQVHFWHQQQDHSNGRTVSP